MKKKYKEKLKKVGNDTVTELEPVIKKGVEDALSILEEVLNDSVTEFFEKRKGTLKP